MRRLLLVCSILLVSTFGVITTVAGNNECSTKWVCERDDKCVRLKKSSTNQLTYTSQNACRLTCGRYGALWPRPTSYTLLGQTLFSFSPNDLTFDFSRVSSNASRYLNEVSDLFLSKILKECGDGCNIAKSDKEITVQYTVQSNETNITWNTDESYRLDVVTNGDQVTVRISGITMFGIRHGLETFSQLITADTCTTGLLLVKSARIEDRPIYRHRGLLLDTSRNFIPISDIKRTIDGMSASKFNVFHWHITDSHSFPLEIPSIPQFTLYGAYSPDLVYSVSDVKHIIRYAKLRGIRVIIEIDSPSHAGNGWNWGKENGLGDLAVCVNAQPWRQFCIQPPCGQLNPVNSLVFNMLREIYRHLLTMLPQGETIHMGGDEVHFGCWNATSEIVNYMYDHGLGRETKDFLQLWAEFHQASLRVWDEESGQDVSSRRVKSNKPKKVIIFSSHLTDAEHIERYLQKDRYVIQTWVETSDELPRQLLEKGYELIMSTKNAWYFDHGFWGVTRFYQWKTAYENRLPVHAGVLGGEACVWSELIDQNNLDSRIWPRASAVAERLWSNPENPAQMAQARLLRHNDRLRAMGIQTEPITPKYCILNEGQCT